jgi:hypothetical protein
MKNATHYAFDLGAVAVCYYFTGWYGVVAFAVVWVAVVAATAWLVLQTEKGSFGEFLLGRMGAVFDAVNEFGAARDAGDVSTLPDDRLVVACAFYGSVSLRSKSMQNVVEANRALAVAEVERRGLDAKLKYAAAEVASARAGYDQRKEALVFVSIVARLLAAAAIVSMAYVDVGGVMHWIARHRQR